MQIQDERKDFSKKSFSNCSRASIKQTLMKHLIKSEIEACCYWAAEMVCSGYYTDLWETILFCFSKYIHVGNPRLPIYLELRFNVFKRLAVDDELEMRNNPTVRRLFSEIMAVMCLSEKRHGYELISVSPDDLAMTVLCGKLKAPDTTYLTVFRPGDPKEVFIPLNEMAYALEMKQSLVACYWVEWIMMFEEQSIKKKKPCLAVAREVARRFKTDVIWLVWELLAAKATNKAVVQACANLFAINYRPTLKRKERRYLLYYAIRVCCEAMELREIVANKELVASITDKCDISYEQLKKYEKKGSI